MEEVIHGRSGPSPRAFRSPHSGIWVPLYSGIWVPPNPLIFTAKIFLYNLPVVASRVLWICGQSAKRPTAEVRGQCAKRRIGSAFAPRPRLCPQPHRLITIKAEEFLVIQKEERGSTGKRKGVDARRVNGEVGQGQAASQEYCCTEPERSAGGRDWKALWGTVGGKPLGRLYAAPAAITRVHRRLCELTRWVTRLIGRLMWRDSPSWRGRRTVMAYSPGRPKSAMPRSKISATSASVRTNASLPTTDIRAARLRLGMTQPVFAECFGVALPTLRKWEQGARHPEGPARVLLRVIETEPDAVRRALAHDVR